VGLFRGNRPVFRSIGETLGLLESESATTEFENGPVRPILDVQASIEAVVDYSEFILLRTDSAGGADTTVDIDPHVLTDWSEIRNRGRTLIGIPGSAVPPTFDAWITTVGVTCSNASTLDEVEIFSLAPTVGAGNGQIIMFFGDTPTPFGHVLRGSADNPPFIVPLPWLIPPLGLQTSTLRMRLNTNGVVSTNLTLGVYSGPPGTFRRIYG